MVLKDSDFKIIEKLFSSRSVLGCESQKTIVTNFLTKKIEHFFGNGSYAIGVWFSPKFSYHIIISWAA